jgi:ubiquinone/menaquinone biosynthesis C-methylase UbiE
MLKKSLQMNLRERLLHNVVVYRLFKNLVSPPKLVAQTVNEFLSVEAGESVLDIGCGYGDLAPYYVGKSRYTGIDSNSSYIREANRRYSHTNAEFLLADVSEMNALTERSFDLVLLTGVLHHLSSSEVTALATSAARLVSSEGRFVAIEPVFAPEQRLSARLLIASDRGRFVRDAEGYTSLLKTGFRDVNAEVIHGRLRIPYSHVVLICRP